MTIRYENVCIDFTPLFEALKPYVADGSCDPTEAIRCFVRAVEHRYSEIDLTTSILRRSYEATVRVTERELYEADNREVAMTLFNDRLEKVRASFEKALSHRWPEG